MVIVGAGFGGLKAARQLRGVDVGVTIIDRRNHHTFQPLLYQVATAGLDSDDICYATRGLFHRQANARALQATVTDIDFDARQVFAQHGAPFEYDFLILALGAVTADFGVPGVAAHAFGLKSAGDAMEIRDHVLRSFERTARVGSDVAPIPNPATSVVIVGGGPTGVEMAGGFAELFSRVLHRDFPEIHPSSTRVTLIEGQDRVLASFHKQLSAKAKTRLEHMGVDVQLSAQVAEITAHEVRLVDGTSVEADTVVWAAGVRAHPLAETLGLQTGRAGRVVVDESLRLPDRPEVFVIGDLAAAEQGDGSLVPQVAPAAVQGGAHAADQIRRSIDGAAASPFTYIDKGSMATIGRNAAVVEVGAMRLSGFVGWIAWLGLHLIMLIGFRNRANVLVNWAWNWLTYDRGSRVIVERSGDEP